MWLYQVWVAGNKQAVSVYNIAAINRDFHHSHNDGYTAEEWVHGAPQATIQEVDLCSLFKKTWGFMQARKC